MKYIVTLNNNRYEVDVERGKASVVRTGESISTVQHNAAAEQPSAPTPALAPPAGKNISEGERLTAPMPGIVLNMAI